VPPEGYPAGVAHERVDRGDREAIADLLGKGPDAVIDLSCYEPDWASFAIEALGADWRGRYVLISSGAVYPETATLPIGEEVEPVGRPLWGEYGASKVEIERRFEALGEATVATLRPPYIVGPGDFMARLQFVFDRLAAAVPVLVPDSGQAVIQLVAADDVAAAIMTLLDAPLEVSAAFNVGPVACVTLSSMAQLCAAALGTEAEIVPVPLAETGVEPEPYSWTDAIFPFADRHYALDSRRLDRLRGGLDYEQPTRLIERTARAFERGEEGRTPTEAEVERRTRERLGLPGLTTTRRRAHA